MPSLPTLPSRTELRKNAVSGFLVFLIALPLCLGISVASGFPPVAGLLSAIVGGVVGSWIGSARLTIKGPAAGLIVIALASVHDLGGGDALLGYKRTLAVGVVAALIQIGLAVVRAGGLAAVMPAAVVHGMLAAIGVTIIAKQAPVALGVVGAHGEPLEMLAHLPHYVVEANPAIAAIGAMALAILFVLPQLPARWQRVPAPMVVLLVTVPMGLLLQVGTEHGYTFAGASFVTGPQFLVQLPDSLLDAVTTPDFTGIWTAASWKYVIMFALVGCIESLLSVIAVDSMDPEKRASNLDADLFAAGVGNLLSALIGGLPMISEIVRSKANIDAGATSRWSNFFHGVSLLLFVALAPGLLQMIPLSALAAMLVVVGARLAAPKEFAHAYHIGRDQLYLFVVTMVATLATDLLVGVGIGLLLKVGMHIYRGARVSRLFRAPFTTHRDGSTLTVEIHGPAVFSNLLPLRRLLTHLDEDVREVVVDFRDATLVDHTFQEKLHKLADEWPTARLSVLGTKQLRPVSEHPLATRKISFGGTSS